MAESSQTNLITVIENLESRIGYGFTEIIPLDLTREITILGERDVFFADSSQGADALAALLSTVDPANPLNGKWGAVIPGYKVMMRGDGVYYVATEWEAHFALSGRAWIVRDLSLSGERVTRETVLQISMNRMRGIRPVQARPRRSNVTATANQHIDWASLYLPEER